MLLPSSLAPSVKLGVELHTERVLDMPAVCNRITDGVWHKSLLERELVNCCSGAAVMLPQGREGKKHAPSFRLGCYWCTVDSEYEEEGAARWGLLVSGWAWLAYHWLDLADWKQPSNEIVSGRVKWAGRTCKKLSDRWLDTTGNTADCGGIFFFFAAIN